MDEEEYLLNLVKQADYPRYLFLLRLSTKDRMAIVPLYGFAAEIYKIVRTATDITIAEIKLKWWQEVLSQERQDEAQAAPLVRALLATIEEQQIPLQPLLDLIEARRFDLYHDLFPTQTEMEGYYGETQGVLFQLTARILGYDQENHKDISEIFGFAGIIYGLTDDLNRLDQWHNVGKSIIPKDIHHNILVADKAEQASAKKTLLEIMVSYQLKIKNHSKKPDIEKIDFYLSPMKSKIRILKQLQQNPNQSYEYSNLKLIIYQYLL